MSHLEIFFPTCYKKVICGLSWFDSQVTVTIMGAKLHLVGHLIDIKLFLSLTLVFMMNLSIKS